MRTGNTATAETEMVKIRYWLLSSMEMDGVSPEHALEKLRAYNAEKIVEYADQIDRKNNNNRLPKYVSGLKESRIESAK
jgi:hypothetical protein